ncbi:MAG: TPM domain-containing protein [Flavobacteriia bacterium]|nr:TPM domain-containing protein [Flavobacteriia bacterium]
MPNKIINESDKIAIQEAIQKAEELTSGEIRVHIDKNCSGEPLKRAIEVFNKLKMHETKERNGVLIYLAFNDRKLAILGDEGIDKKVANDFWDSTKEQLILDFKNNQFIPGIIKSINEVGVRLKEYFPHQVDDIDELSNEITFD